MPGVATPIEGLQQLPAVPGAPPHPLPYIPIGSVWPVGRMQRKESTGAHALAVEHSGIGWMAQLGLGNAGARSGTQHT
jgi:hypothetical protein